MNKEEFENYLESIGGLVNGCYPDRESIISAGYFCVGSGWYEIIKNIIEELIADGWDKQICQVKEKFGGLRFYTNGGGENHHKIISKYENLSYKTCEKCGDIGKQWGKNWIYTLCSKHYIEYIFNKINTKYEHGFINSEIELILLNFPDINMEKFNDALFGDTCMVIDDDIIHYHHDILNALYCGIENRDQTIGEWD